MAPLFHPQGVSPPGARRFAATTARQRGEAGTRTEGGFTYLGLIFAIAVMGGVLAAAGEVWHTAQTRERERELLFVGNQFRQAIGSYYESSPGAVKRYPQALEDLLRDPRHPGVKRHLRKLYADPISGKPEWGVVKGADGGIMGVHSLSEEQPLKTANFRDADRAFEGKTRYADWLFVYKPKPPPAGADKKPGVAG